MPEIKVTPLGAGQDVGRSCLLVNIGSKNIMLDCGMHMGFQGRTNSETDKLVFGPLILGYSTAIDSLDFILMLRHFTWTKYGQ